MKIIHILVARVAVLVQANEKEDQNDDKVRFYEIQLSAAFKKLEAEDIRALSKISSFTGNIAASVADPHTYEPHPKANNHKISNTALTLGALKCTSISVVSNED